MDRELDNFDRFYEQMLANEPETLRKLVQGWKVLENRGLGNHRVLLIGDDLGEKRILKQVPLEHHARMQAEVEVLTNAHVAGIPKLYEYAEDEQYVYMVREYVEGVNLEEWITRYGTMSMREAAHIGGQLCLLLEQLHRLNIIHRDVKPQNVILTPDRRVYLIDFDISRKFNQGDAHDTEYLGTPSIAPPEQFGYGQTDARTDIYSLGVVLLFMCSGTYDLRTIPKLPVPIRLVVRKCTYFAPERRCQTAAKVRRRLFAVEHRMHRRLGALFLAVLIICVAVGGWVATQQSQKLFPTLTQMAAAETVTFREPLIAQCVRAQLGKAVGDPLTYGEVSEISEIFVYGDYTDGKAHDPEYKGDQVYVNGQKINHGSITDLSDLLMMPRLRVLRLYRQPLSNTDALAPLVKLEELALDESPNVGDISSIKDLEWLRKIDLSDTAVSDITPMKGCPRLREINLERIPCKDYSVLAQYPYLEYLNVNEASPALVMDAVSGKMVDNLWLDYSGLTDIKPFAMAESVEQLHAKHNEIRSLDGIQALTMLKYVDVAYNPVEDLSPLLALPRLEALRIDPGLKDAWEKIADQAKFKIEWEQ